MVKLWLMILIGMLSENWKLLAGILVAILLISLLAWAYFSYG